MLVLEKRVFIVSRFLEGNNSSIFTGHGSIMTCSHNNLKLLPMYWSRYFYFVKPPWSFKFSSDLRTPLGTWVQTLFLLNTILLVLFEFMSVIYISCHALLLWTILFKSKTLIFHYTCSSLQQSLMRVNHQVCPNTRQAKRWMRNEETKKLDGLLP